MNKLLLTTITVFLLLGLVVPASAQFGWLPKAGVTPDSPFYFLDQWGEGISMAFSFSNEARANKALRFSEERLAEMRTMAEKGKTEQAEKLAEKYQRTLSSVQERSEQTKEEQKREEVTARVASSTSRHLSVLEDVLGKTPEEARSAIEEARESSKQGHIRSLNALSETNPEQAAKIGSKGIQERLERIKSATGTEQVKQVRAALGDFEDLSENLQEMANRSNQARVQQIVASSTSRHLRELERVREQAPEEAQQGLQRAMEASRQGRERAMEALRKGSQEGDQEAEEALDKMEEAGPPVPVPGPGQDEATSTPSQQGQMGPPSEEESEQGAPVETPGSGQQSGGMQP